MLFKLVQGSRLLDVATTLPRLAFSRLNGCDDWEIKTVGDDLAEPVACVRWEAAARYLLQVEDIAIGIYHHDLIIPTLIGQLKRLEGLPGPRPTIYVSAEGNS